MFQLSNEEILVNHKEINSVEFPISFGHSHYETIRFDWKNREEALEAVNDYFNQPFSKEYYERIKDDLDPDEVRENTWEWVSQNFTCKGDFMGTRTVIDNYNLGCGDLHLDLSTE